MSTIILSQCWPLRLSPTQKLVLISLADQANDEGACWPSIASIQRRTNLSERAVRGALRGLEEVRLLQTHARDGSSNWYTVTPMAYTPAADAAPAPAPAAPRHQMPTTPARGAPNPGTSRPPPRHVVPPEPSLNHQVTVNQPSARGTRLPKDWQPDVELLAYANERGWNGQALTDEIENFRDYWTARSGAGATKLDWPATFRTWIRKARKPHDRTDHSGAGRRPSLAERAREHERAAHAREAAAGAHGDPVAPDDRNLRPPLDGSARRVG